MFLGPLKAPTSCGPAIRERPFHSRENHLVTTFNVALRLSAVESGERPFVNHGQGWQTVIHQSADEFQIQVVDEVVATMLNHATLGKQAMTIAFSFSMAA